MIGVVEFVVIVESRWAIMSIVVMSVPDDGIRKKQERNLFPEGGTADICMLL
jgi:hypothetical protein